LIEDAFDAQTKQIIQSLGVAAGGKCKVIEKLVNLLKPG